MLKNLTMIALPLVLVACAEDTKYVDDTTEMQPRVASFEEARANLNDFSALHMGEVMEEVSVAEVALAEVEWSQHAELFADDMEGWLVEMRACTDANGDKPATEGAFQALEDLRVELRAHYIGMITVQDLDTAQAAEQNFKARQDVLLDELKAHFETFDAAASSFRCAF